MKDIRIRNIETDRLILKVPTMEEQKELWSILKDEKVNRLYFPTPDRIFKKNNLSKEKVEDLIEARKIFLEQLNDWERQEPFYEKKVVSIHNGDDNNKFTWSIFLKSGEVIGQMTVQPSEFSDGNPAIRDVGWFINPKHHRNGYASEAAKAILDFMFNEVEIDKIITSAATTNPGSWKIMEKLGFQFIKSKPSTYLDENNNLLESSCYEIIREEYINFNK